MSDQEGQRSSFSNAAIQGTAWRYVAFFSGKLMVFVSTVVLARLLTKDDYGLVGYAVTAISFLDVISDLGVVPALIYYPENKRTSGTAFWLNLLISFLFFSLAWILAPLAAAYFRDARVEEVVRVLAFNFPLKALGDIHESVLLKKLSYSRTFLPDFLKAMAKGIISIGFAASGFGAWSLIWGQLGGTLVSSLTFWVMTPWRPNLIFDFSKVKLLLGYGVGFVGGDILNIVLLNLDYLLVGRYLGSEELGVYTLSFRLPDLLIMQFARILSWVIFPIYTRMKDEPDGLARGFAVTTRYVSLLTVPLGIGLALISQPFTYFVFTEKWVEAIPVIRTLALYAMFLSIAHNINSAYRASGRLKVVTWMGVFRLALLFPALWWATTFASSIVAVGWAQAVVACISTIVNLLLAARLLGLPLKELIAALRPSVLAGSVMLIVVLFVLNLSQMSGPWVQLIFSVLSGGIAYGGILWFVQRQTVLDAVRKLRTAVSRSGSG